MHDLACGCWAAEDVVKILTGVDVSKALDPTDPDDFVRIVERLARRLSRVSGEAEAAALNAALDALDVDWPNLSGAQRREIMRAADLALRPLPQQVLPVVNEQFDVAGERTVRGAKRGQRRRLGVRVATATTLRDKRVLNHLISSQALFVSDEYGRRRAGFSAVARRIVTDALEEGLGRDEIAGLLQESLGPGAAVLRNRRYWQVVSGVFTNRARTYGQLRTMSDARVDRYRFEAVLDERTTEECRFLHGKVFTVRAGLNLYERTEVAADPQDVKDIMPWLRHRKDADGNTVIFRQNRAGERLDVAVVTRSGIGSRDDVGEHRQLVSDQRLSEEGIIMPPLHGLCRSSIVSLV